MRKEWELHRQLMNFGFMKSIKQEDWRGISAVSKSDLSEWLDFDDIVKPDPLKDKIDMHMILQPIATEDEVVAAIDLLSQADLLRIRGYAQFRMRAVPATHTYGRNFEDLISEALTATISGQRRWNKSAVDFVGHLCGAIRSISSHWRTGGGAEYSSSTKTQIDQPGRDSISEIPSQRPDAERQVAAAQQIEQIKALFANDHMVINIIDGMSEGLNGRELKAKLGLSQVELESTMRRLRRGVHRMEKEKERHL